MKDLFKMTAALLLLAGCMTQEPEEPAGAGQSPVFTASFEDAVTKTFANSDLHLFWTADDRLSIFINTYNQQYRFMGKTGDNSGDFEEVKASGFHSGSDLDRNYAFYPYSASTSISYEGTFNCSLPAVQAYAQKSFGLGANTMVAVTQNPDDRLLRFKNLCGYLVVKLYGEGRVRNIELKGNNGEKIAGAATVAVEYGKDPQTTMSDTATETVTIDCGETGAALGASSAEATEFWFCIPPVTFSKGFSIRVTDTKGEVFEKGVTSSKAITRNVVNSLAALKVSFAPDALDLSVDGSANCYVVSKYDSYKFDATRKGPATESVGAIASAEVLWESFGNDVEPQAGDIVSNVSVKDGFVYFTASGKDGNAVIAVKDAAGDILWSWHIWVCQGFDPDATAQVYNNNAGTVMDRNLGATSAAKGDVKALGLMYQWGRKDPFLGGEAISSNTQAKSTISSWPAPVASDASNGTIDYVVKHPTTFVSHNTSNNDWYYTGNSSTDNTRWSHDKGMYDPCPKGWRVPDGGYNGLWHAASVSTEGTWDSANNGIDLTGNISASSSVWYPAQGQITSSNGLLRNVGYGCFSWSCTPNNADNYHHFAFDMCIMHDGKLRLGYANRADGCAVRCVKDSNSENEKNISANGTANCYVVNEYGQCRFDASNKGPAQSSVGKIASAEVLWESFGNDEQPKAGDIVSNVCVKNGGFVHFTASGKDGNAVIAVKDAAGDILWSWHIWVCQGFDPDASAQVYNNNAGTVMDRNLGATSAAKGDVKALGLLYQWGRKDPFLSGRSISSGTQAAESTISWPSPVSCNASNGTIDYVVKHPTTFVLYNTSNNDWYYTGNSSTDDTRWSHDKGMYDPCPKGWRVPDGGKNGLWAIALETSNIRVPWDDTNKGMDFKDMFSASSVWYPAQGSMQSTNGLLRDVGKDGKYWSCTPNITSDSSYFAFFFYMSDFNEFVNPSAYGGRASGYSVRCVKEN